MDSIEISEPGAIVEGAVNILGDFSGTADAGSPNRAPPERWRGALRSTLRWSGLLLIVWTVGAALLGAIFLQARAGAVPLQWPQDWPVLFTSVREPALFAQMTELALRTLNLVYLPAIVLALVIWSPIPLAGFRQRGTAANGATHRAAPGTLQLPWLAITILKFTLIAFTLIAAGYIARAAWAIAEGDDPIRVLPGITPPYLREFRVAHPGFGADDDRNSMDHVILRGGQGQTLRLHRTELAGAQARFEPCPAALDSTQLGGIQPYPQAHCTTLLRLSKGGGEETYYVFEVAGESDRAAVLAHFGKWVAEDSAGGATAIRKGGGFTLSAGSRDGAWHLDVDSHNVRATTIVIRHTRQAAR